MAARTAAIANQIVPTLGKHLESEFGRSFAEKNLRRMVQFAEVFPDRKIVVSLIRQLSWTHFIALIPLKDPLQRELYAEMCRIEHWTLQAAGAGYMKLHAGNASSPTSTVNFAANQTRSNNTVVRLSTNGDGTIAITPVLAGGGTVHVILDVEGYFE